MIFDYIGTLVNCKGYSMNASKENLYSALLAEGFEVSAEKFLEAYDLAHEKYRIVRYEQLREVTNSVWVAEALNNLGFDLKADDDPRVIAALNVFFKAYVDTFELRDGAKKTTQTSPRARQSWFNLKFYPCTSDPQKSTNFGHQLILQCNCSFR